MTNDAAWREYERQVFAEIISKYPDAKVDYDVRLPGRRSSVPRQVDVLITERTSSGEIVTAVDAKHHTRPIDVKEVESFIGLLNDVSVARGVMISVSGYTEAALNRAFREDLDIDLDIFSLGEYQQWQSCGAIPFSGGNGVLLPTPLGWVVDVERFPHVIARLYRRGITFDRACTEKEWMYINFWDRATVSSLDHLLAQQAAEIRDTDRDAFIHVEELEPRPDARLVLRRAEIANYPAAEITGFAEFEAFIFFAVLFTPLAIERRNVRKLEYILRSILPISVRLAA